MLYTFFTLLTELESSSLMFNFSDFVAVVQIQFYTENDANFK